MSELGFHRSAKKCKEKFENVFKYHKRTKEGRASKPDGKTYRFFDQLEALENNPPHQSLPPPPPPPRPLQLPSAPTTMAAAPMPAPGSATPSPTLQHHVTVSSTLSPNPVSVSVSPNISAHNIHIPISTSLPPSQPILPPINTTYPSSHQNMSTSFLSNSTSSSTSSDEDIQRRGRRKRKWKDFFERLMKDVIDKQEEMQKRFLETLEKRERDRMIREEAWRVQEMARMNREHDLLVQERQMAAAKDAAVIAFLQKVTEQQNLQNPITTNQAASQLPQTQVQIQLQETTPLPAAAAPQPPPPPQTLPQTTSPTPILSTPAPVPLAAVPLPKHVDVPKMDNGGGDNFVAASSSRWPKAEVQALIKLRTSLDLKYQESGPKGPLWEEISASMHKLGYNRSAKRCKEKWENINKYFKKVKESNKKRPEDSKTCPYFHQLDALYREKAKNDASTSFNSTFAAAVKPENPMVPIMARPEQQWPLPPDHQPHQDSTMDDPDSDNMDQNDHEDEDGDDDDEDEDEGDGYEIVTNKPSAVPTTATTTATLSD